MHLWCKQGSTIIQILHVQVHKTKNGMFELEAITGRENNNSYKEADQIFMTYYQPYSTAEKI